ncbi:GTP cyclohydrolase II, partial [Candidatus Woesearchaeota archaeon]|nr:GTP cyclohydrolase II [Candidatus Woesearchaeota archaeon]
CLTSDVFASQRCDCGDQLATALELIEKEGNGILLYLRQEGRGIGLLSKLQAYHLQEKGFDTVEANEMLGYPADSRDYAVAASILCDLEIASIRLLTNNPKKINALSHAGIVIRERIPLELPSGPHNKLYMQTKKEKLGHLFDHV